MWLNKTGPYQNRNRVSIHTKKKKEKNIFKFFLVMFNDDRKTIFIAIFEMEDIHTYELSTQNNKERNKTLSEFEKWRKKKKTPLRNLKGIDCK